jgi:hypothetical protein
MALAPPSRNQQRANERRLLSYRPGTIFAADLRNRPFAARANFMIVISRNGQTTVISGWRAWLLGAVTFVVAMLILAVIAFVFVGLAITIGAIAMIVIPALVVVALLASLFGRPR